MNSNNIIALILLIIAVLGIVSLTTTVSIDSGKEKFGMGATYYVYTPTRDVRKNNCGQSQFMTSQQLPAQNLGWRTGMPYDNFEEIKSNSCVSPSNNGGYMKNYGSPCAANTNMDILSEKTCPSVNAYNLGVGVL